LSLIQWLAVLRTPMVSAKNPEEALRWSSQPAASGPTRHAVHCRLTPTSRTPEPRVFRSRIGTVQSVLGAGCGMCDGGVDVDDAAVAAGRVEQPLTADWPTPSRRSPVPSVTAVAVASLPLFRCVPASADLC